MAKGSWMKRFGDSISHHAGEQLSQEILFGSEGFNAFPPNRKAEWMHKAMLRLDASLPRETTASIMQKCSCEPNARLTKARKLYMLYKNFDLFLDRLSRMKLLGDRIERHGDVIFIHYDYCVCQRVNATRIPISRTFCQCSVGYVHKVFEIVMDRKVEVELNSSIINGDVECKFTVRLLLN